MWPFRSRWSCDIQNMLFISTRIFDDKLRPQILSVGTTANSPLSEKVTTAYDFLWKGLLFHSREMGLCSPFPVKNVIEFSRRYKGYSFVRATVHMWQRAKSNEQAFKIWSLPLKDQWLNWPFNFTWLIAKFAFWKIKGGYAFLFKKNWIPFNLFISPSLYWFKGNS
jgi:hypothetical protein